MLLLLHVPCVMRSAACLILCMLFPNPQYLSHEDTVIHLYVFGDVRLKSYFFTKTLGL